jgi:hypothetical protein
MKRILWILAAMLVCMLVCWMPAPSRAQTVVQFWAYDFYTRSYYQVGLTQKYVSSRARVYGGPEVSSSQAQQVGQAFDGIYNNVTGILGQPPDVDGDPLIYILITDIKDVYDHDPMAVSFVRAYFDPRNQAPTTYSNGREIIYLDNVQQLPTETEAKRALAHELGRMIVWGADRDEEAWLVEGIGYLAERIAGYGHRPEIGSYLADPSRPLVGWTGSAPDAGASYLLLLYVYEQFGASAVQSIVQSSANGLDSVAAAVGLSSDGLFRRWALANYLDSSGIYRYTSLDIVDSGEDNVTKFRRTAATMVSRPLPNERREMVGVLCGGGIRYYKTAPGSRTDEFVRIGDEKAREAVWSPTLDGSGFGASWMKNNVLLQEGRLDHTSTDVPASDSFLLCVSPFRARGAVDYRYVLHGTYTVFLPVVTRNYSSGE